MDAIMKSPQSIQDLVVKAQGGDRDALSALFEEYRARLLTWIRLRMGQGLRGRLEAQDVLQQTFLKAIQSIGSFRWQGEGSYFAWLTGIAANLVLDFGDPRRRKPPSPLEADVPAGGVAPSKALR